MQGFGSSKTPDETVSYYIHDEAGNAIMIVAERVGTEGTISVYQVEYLGGIHSGISWERAKEIALGQYKEMEKALK